MPLPVDLIASAAEALKQRSDEVNRLNVFPVPDGDTGTNMSLTVESVVSEVRSLPADASMSAVCQAVTHGSLMGARGNSGVILSQILRGLCEGLDSNESVDLPVIAQACERSVTVAFQAVRKPVEGTMLTVARDVAEAATRASEEGLDLENGLKRMSEAAFASVKRTPELLPVLKENGVVDAGGFGLAILLEGFIAALLDVEAKIVDVSVPTTVLSAVAPVDDWDDDEYLYCTEFLLFGEGIDREAVHDFVASVGGSELVVGDHGQYKVHVHTDEPGLVLNHVTAMGEVAEVHIHNMRRQQQERDEMLRVEEADSGPRKDIGIVAVAAGDGLTEILRSLGVDVIVGGGQTMNPSTKDLLAAVERVNADAVIVLPNNKNIVMAANAAASVADRPVAVVPTRSVPAAFSALLAFDGTAALEDVVERMSDAARSVKTAEITRAVKDARGKVGEIVAGQVIGIIDDDEIEAVGEDILSVALKLAELLDDGERETLTLLTGEELAEEDAAQIEEEIAAAHPDFELEVHAGGQPLYPLIMFAE
jgi:uncharacterized protein